MPLRTVSGQPLNDAPDKSISYQQDEAPRKENNNDDGMEASVMLIEQDCNYTMARRESSQITINNNVSGENDLTSSNIGPV